MLFHDGEAFKERLVPCRGREEKDLAEYIALCMQGNRPDLVPSTLEGCVVRMCDMVAYIGQDIEDAVRLGILKLKEVPDEVIQNLGKNNSEIINSLVSDLVSNSLETDSIGLSTEIAGVFRKLKDFNYERIYMHPEIRRERQRIQNAFRMLFDHFLEELEKKKPDSIIFQHFLGNRSPEYVETTSPAEKVRDYLATMTDRYFAKAFPVFMCRKCLSDSPDELFAAWYKLTIRRRIG